MRDNDQKEKLSKIISVSSVVLSLIAIILSLISIRLAISNGKDTKFLVTILLSNITIFLSCSAGFANIMDKYKKKFK
jgi:hypothetical protein